MENKPEDISSYIDALTQERRVVFNRLREVIIDNLPTGFDEVYSYKMIGYVVPHSIYPKGYHCDPKLPLPFINIASQKNFIAIYHMGIYSNEDLLAWFKEEYPKHCTNKLDMGKSCIRFKNIKKIPYQLIGQLAKKMTVEQWVNIYESASKQR
ncbi:MAG: DUF1801 domain-containing protein [Colwellia sp.]|nr:DUF1801 domain-containing protein [Colwellia sp.]